MLFWPASDVSGLPLVLRGIRSSTGVGTILVLLLGVGVEVSSASIMVWLVNTESLIASPNFSLCLQVR